LRFLLDNSIKKANRGPRKKEELLSSFIAHTPEVWRFSTLLVNIWTTKYGARAVIAHVFASISQEEAQKWPTLIYFI